jgi:hypothetical protein
VSASARAGTLHAQRTLPRATRPHDLRSRRPVPALIAVKKGGISKSCFSCARDTMMPLPTELVYERP